MLGAGHPVCHDAKTSAIPTYATAVSADNHFYTVISRISLFLPYLRISSAVRCLKTYISSRNRFSSGILTVQSACPLSMQSAFDSAWPKVRQERELGSWLLSRNNFETRKRLAASAEAVPDDASGALCWKMVRLSQVRQGDSHESVAIAGRVTVVRSRPADVVRDQ